jgi:pathogenesis-related protein 1
MRARVAGLLLLLAGACGGTSSNTSGSQPDAGSFQSACTAGDASCAFVAAHDAARAAAQPTPSPLLPSVGWSGAAAQAAASWAARCNWGHDPSLRSEGYGQNLYASTIEPAPADAVASWVSEAPDYDYASNTCAAGKVCGHYTQVVWRGSTGLGCATQRCTTGSPFGATAGGTWWNVVCDYVPPGNWVGQRPY